MKHGLTNKCSVSTDFETSRQEHTLEYLAKYFDNSATGMTTSKYLQMCEMMGDTPDPRKLPPEYMDFPGYVHDSIDIFNALPDTYSGGMSTVYVGKDLSSLSVLFDLFLVAQDYRMKVFRVIQFLDNRARKQAIKEANKARK